MIWFLSTLKDCEQNILFTILWGYVPESHENTTTNTTNNKKHTPWLGISWENKYKYKYNQRKKYTPSRLWRKGAITWVAPRCPVIACRLKVDRLKMLMLLILMLCFFVSQMLLIIITIEIDNVVPWSASAREVETGSDERGARTPAREIRLGDDYDDNRNEW